MAREKVKKPFYKRWWVWVLAALVVVALINPGDEGTEQATKTEQTDEPKTDQAAEDNNNDQQETQTDENPPPPDEGVLTEEKFAQIKDGMTYEEVVAIIGSEGKVISESGERGTEYHTVMYEFETEGAMSNANMMFQGNKLMNKAQFGLGGGSDVEMTLEQFNQIQNGMTYEEVKAIVGGEGEIVSESGEKGSQFHTVVYSYQGKGSIGANASLTFQGNKLQNKSQFGLE
nr:DUF3862 domain-containing protein [Neobacillus sp. Marseille-Q6967]